jgi:hypothetical protein
MPTPLLAMKHPRPTLHLSLVLYKRAAELLSSPSPTRAPFLPKLPLSLPLAHAIAGVRRRSTWRLAGVRTHSPRSSAVRRNSARACTPFTVHSCPAIQTHHWSYVVRRRRDRATYQLDHPRPTWCLVSPRPNPFVHPSLRITH